MGCEIHIAEYSNDFQSSYCNSSWKGLSPGSATTLVFGYFKESQTNKYRKSRVSLWVRSEE